MASVLILTPQSPYPPRQGTALRNWGLLKGLAAHHRVSLLTFAASDQALTPDPELAQVVERVALVPQLSRSSVDRLRDLVTTTFPDLARRLVSAQFRAVLDDWLTHYHFDWVLIEGLEMAPYVVEGTHRAANIPEGTRIAFDDHNCEYVLQRRTAGSDWLQPLRWPSALYSSIQWRRLRRYEAEVCTRADVVVAVSAADAAALRAVVPTLDPLVIPNGIDVAAYAEAIPTAEAVPTALAQPAFVFTGTMDFRPNVDGVLWFANLVWPRIRAALPEAHFYIVGRRPHRRLNALRKHPGITITGSLDDTRPHIRGAAVYVVPLLVGGGTRLKLLESTAMGKAVVATSLAAEGFVEPERAMVLADTAATFADACIALARDADARAVWGSRARAYVQAYDWAKLLPPLLTRLG